MYGTWNFNDESGKCTQAVHCFLQGVLSFWTSKLLKSFHPNVDVPSQPERRGKAPGSSRLLRIICPPKCLEHFLIYFFGSQSSPLPTTLIHSWECLSGNENCAVFDATAPSLLLSFNLSLCPPYISMLWNKSTKQTNVQ